MIQLSPQSLVEFVVRALPYPEQIRGWEWSGEKEVRFTWRNIRFRVSASLGVEEVRDGMLVTSETAILVRALLRTRYTLEA